MVHLRITFPGGRYHGTRWGSHANEGDVDWPPSPWRIVRALLAAGYNRLGWSADGVPAAAVELVEALSAVLPVYHLPPGATEAHTRHYMPTYKGETGKVLDSFVHVGAESLGVSWPVELSPASLETLDQLLAQLSYVGRAESWAEAERVDAATAGTGIPCEAGNRLPGAEPIRLLAPMAAEPFLQWRAQAVAKAMDDALASRQRTAEGKGKKPPTKLNAKDTARVEAQFPVSLIDALSATTGELRKQGWNRPPGSTEVVYWRPRSAMDPAPTGRFRPARATGPLPTVALYAISSDTVAGTTLPRLATAIWRGDLLHKTMTSLGDRVGRASVFSGRTDEGIARGHRHAHYVSLALGASGPRSGLPDAAIDHALIWAPGGFDLEAQEALLGLRRTYAAKIDALSLACLGFGGPELFADWVAPTRASTVWISQTPFVPPRYLARRGRHNLEGQVRAELVHRGLPEPASVQVEREDGGWSQLPPDGRLAPWWRHFELERPGDKAGNRPPQRATFGLRLVFDRPLTGPLTLGFGAHFGLGLFVPGDP